LMNMILNPSGNGGRLRQLRRTIYVIGVICAVLLMPAFAQVDEARQAIDNGEYVKAVNLLSAALAGTPTADTYLYLGIAYGHMKEYEKAEDVLKEGSKRFPADARLHNQLADLFLENNDSDAARGELQSALGADSGNNYASDLLASINMS